MATATNGGGSGVVDFPVVPPVCVLSDLHLGHPASYLRDPRAIVPLLGPARTAIFNGDTCELLNVQRRDLSRDLLKDLTDLCIDRGVRPLFLTGNHDPFVSSAHYFDLFDGKVFLTHGDCLHPMVAPWSREGPLMWRERQRLLAGRREPRTLDEIVLLAKRSEMVAAIYQAEVHESFLARIEMLSRFIIRPKRILLTLDYWANVAHYCHKLKGEHRPKARLMLIGHTHRAGVWQAKDYALVNTGSFQPLSRPLVVHFNERRAVVYRVARDGEVYRLGGELHHISLD